VGEGLGLPLGQGGGCVTSHREEQVWGGAERSRSFEVPSPGRGNR
jgi:hypothetical protein